MSDFHSQYQQNHLITSTIKTTDLAQSTRLITNFFSINENINCKSIEYNQLTNLENKKIICYSQKNQKMMKIMIKKIHNKISIKMTLSRFLFVKNDIIKIISGLFLPPILEKDLSESDSDMIISKKMTDCYNFINEICKDNILRSSKVFYDFVIIEKENDFQIKSNYKLVDDMINELEVFSLDGLIFSEGQKFDKNKIYMKKNMNILLKLIDILKTLIKDFDTVNKSIKLVGESFNELLTQSYNFP